MWSKIVYLCCISLLVFATDTQLVAQDYRILTTIYKINTGPKNKPKPIYAGRNLTIFHAGEAYDRIEGVNEITIYQPARRQFTIFSEARMLATEISFEKIQEIQLDMDRQTREYIQFLKKKGDDSSLREAKTLEFQLLPQFLEKFDARKKKLTMSSNQYSYTVKTIAKVNPEIARGYLEYADWMARLNPLLHSTAMFPAPRLQVNESLRARDLMPQQVDRQRHIVSGAHLQAQHEVKWKLDKSDERSIYEWKRMLQSDEMKWIDFAKFKRRSRSVDKE